MGYIRLNSQGSQEVERMLGTLSEVPAIAQEAVEAGVNILLPAAQAAAPVGPKGGTHIKNRIEARTKGINSPSAEVGVWGEPVAYYVEKGHGGPHPAPAHPYLEPTAEAVQDEVLEAVTDVISQWLDG